MKKILLADQSKAGLVMISEIFKDHYPGIQVLVAKTSAEVLQVAQDTDQLDAIILDYHLPDLNGASTALQLKEQMPTPVFITAFESPEVADHIETLLGEYNDCRSWLKKPIQAEVLVAVIQRHCEGKIRAEKRLPCQIQAQAKIITQDQKEISFHISIDDCSLNGIKIKPVNNSKMPLKMWTNLLQELKSVQKEDSIELTIPSCEAIEYGQKNTPSQILIGRIAWSGTQSNEWGLGVEILNPLLSKRLFETVVAISAKQAKSYQNQSFLKNFR